MNPHYRPKPRKKAETPFKGWLDGELARQKKFEGALGAAAEAWCAEVPPEWGCEVVGLRRGVLTMRVPDASAMYGASIMLRSGLARRIVKATDGKVQQVRVRII